jgi:hypothetical protein
MRLDVKLSLPSVSRDRRAALSPSSPYPRRGLVFLDLATTSSNHITLPSLKHLRPSYPILSYPTSFTLRIIRTPQLTEFDHAHDRICTPAALEPLCHVGAKVLVPRTLWAGRASVRACTCACAVDGAAVCTVLFDASAQL